MKPKYRRIAKTLPAIITLVMVSATVSNAAILDGLPTGNVTVTTLNDGGNAVDVSGGTDPNPFVLVEGGALIDGDAAQFGVINVSNVAYAITNNGTIDSSLGDEGIQIFAGSGGSVITNNGSIISTGTDAIVIDTDGGTVNNMVGGVISGDSDGITAFDDLVVSNSGLIEGLNDNGIVANDNADITNLEGGTITGDDSGIDALDQLTLSNAGTITGINTDGVVARDNTDIANLTGGTITGDDDGIDVGDNALISNAGLISGNFGYGIFAGNDLTVDNLAGGTITGDEGIDAGDFLTVTNAGMIIGTGSDGILAFDDAFISNSGTITGIDDGIDVGDNADITNGGTISGGTGNGVAVGANSIVSNSGTITSDSDYAVRVFGAGLDTFELTNSGVIGGDSGLAFLGDASDDELNLDSGSRVIGEIDGLGGDNTIIMNGGLGSPNFSASGASSNSILGDVLNIDTITKNDGGVAFIGVPGPAGPPQVNGFTVNADVINISPTEIDAIGGLYINGDIASADGLGNAQINANGAALGGTGTWNADIDVTRGGFSAGAIPINLDSTPTNSIGTVTVNGDVTHSAVSFIRYDVQPGAFAQDGVPLSGVTTPFLNPSRVLVSGGSTADLIDQNGVYNMGGGFVRIAATNDNAAISDGTYVIVQSDQNVQGSVQLRPNVQFNSNVVDNGPFFGTETGSNSNTTVLGSQFSTVTIVGDQLLLNVNHDFSSLALDENAAAFGNALDASINSGNFLTQDFIAALDNSDLATVQATLSAASPNESFANTVAIVSGNYRLNRLVQDHLALTRAGGDTVRMNVGSYSAPAPAPEPMVQNSGVGNVWGTVSYAWKDIESNGAGNFDGEEASFTAGFDYRVAPNFLLGIVLDGSTGDYDFNGGSSDVESFRAAIYGTYGAPTGIYADFLVGYGDHDSDLSRNAGILGSLNGSGDSESLQAMLIVGYAMQSDCVKHGPFAGIEYQDIDVDSFNTGGAFPIAVDGYDVESLRLLAGYRAEAAYGKFTPYASVAYAHELEDDAIRTTATIPGGAGFGISGSGLESAILISLGTNYAISDSLSLNAGYHGEISVGGDEGTDSHGASLGLNYAF